MKRKLLSMAVAALTVATASAVPAKRLVKTITQPDGTTVTVTQMGDERYHAYVTSDGLAVNFTDDGYAVYQTTDGVSTVYVHEPVERSASEKAFVDAQQSNITFKANREASPRYKATAKRNVASASEPKRVQGRISIEQGSSQVPHKGSCRVPVLLVQYSDIKFKDSDPKSTFENFFAGTSGTTAYQYFNEMSQGQYQPQFDVYGPYTLSNNRKYYGGSDSNGEDEKPGEMTRDAIVKANSEVDFSLYDNDGNGTCDVLIILYAGVGQASSGVVNSVWPCQWTLSESEVGSSYTADGVTIDDFAVFNELNGTTTSKIDGIGTFCHEFSHCLGLPDFYETTYSNGYYGMDEWSLMDYGSYNNDGYTPVGYSAYEKAYMGWMTLTEGVANTQYTLPVQNKKTNPEDYAVVLINGSNKNEYFIFENRNQQGWDAYMSDTGMLINHVTYSASKWTNNTVNNSSTQCMTIVPADNKLSNSTNTGDLWPKSGVTEFTNTSTPAAKTNSGGYLNCPVTEITRDSSTGVVTFWVDKAAAPELDTPLPADEVVINGTDSFTASWAPVSIDGTTVSYTMQVWPENAASEGPALYSDFLNNKNTSIWSTNGYVSDLDASKEVQIGSNKKSGYIQSTTEVTPVDGTITVVVNGKSYGNDSDCKVVMTIVNGSSAVASKSISAPSSYEYVTNAFTDLDDSKSYKIRVGITTNKKRILVASVMAFAGAYADQEDSFYDDALNNAASSAPALAPSVSTSGSVTTISGITDTKYTVTGLTEDVYYYRVKAVPADTSVASASQWSETKTIDFSASGVSTAVAEQPAQWTVVNGTIVADASARLFSISGVEVKAQTAGHFAPAAGVYILVVPGSAPAKIVL